MVDVVRILDNLPVAIKKERADGASNSFFYDRGFPVGFKVPAGDSGVRSSDNLCDMMDV